MSGRSRPILLIVSGDGERLARVRDSLRGAGVLTSGCRSVEAALSLLEHVAMDGCVLADGATPLEAARLGNALEDLRPGSPRLCLADLHPLPTDGWVPCAEPDLAATVSAAFGMADG